MQSVSCCSHFRKDISVVARQLDFKNLLIDNSGNRAVSCVNKQ